MHKKNEQLNFLFMSGTGELERVDAERQKRHWSWAQFAREVHESPQTVQNWRKRRRIPGDKKYAVAQAFGKSVEWLIAGEEEGTKVPSNGAVESVISSATEGKERREPVYPTEPFNRFGKLAQLWPYLTDESQNDIIDKIERLVHTSRHGLSPPAIKLKAEGAKKIRSRAK